MNTKNIILASAFALGLASAASGQTTVRLTGSTAFRASVHNALLSIMSGETYAYGGNDGTFANAAHAIFHGTIGGEAVIVKTSWSGSVGGIQALDSPASLVTNFINSSVIGTAGGLGGQAATVDEEAEIAMSDVFQGSTVFQNTELIDTVVAVVPFKILSGKGAPASLTNITSLSFQALYSAGKVPLALVTGQNADRTTKLYAMGRDNSSGTRLTTLADTGLGALSTVIQYSFDGATYLSQGNGGYTSGGNVRTALSATATGALGYNIAYIGLSDSVGALTAGAKELSYNGVTYSATAVAEGSYTLWGYQHLFTREDIGEVENDVATALANSLIANPGSSGLLLSTMGVTRLAEGAPIGNKYATP